METITESVANFFNHDKIRFEQIGEDRVLKIGFDGENGTFFCDIEINEEKRTFQIHTTSPVKVPKNRRQRTAELIARINPSFVLGNFEIDMDTGLISYKTSIILGKSGLHEDVIKHLLYANWMASDKCSPAISIVAFGNVSPKRVAELMEHPHHPDSFDTEEDNSTKRVNGWLRDFFGQSLN
jgi:hypothetical protein